MNFYLLLLYFLAGVISDFLFIINMRFVAKERVFSAAFVAFLNTVISLYVLYSILTEIQTGRGIFAILVYALGIGTGTYIAMRLKLEK